MRFLILLLYGGVVYASLLGAAAAAAQSSLDPLPLPAGLARSIPADAQRGVLQRSTQGVATIGGKELRMAPGMQIRDTHNRIVLSDALGQPHLVKYLIDAQGQLFRVWILTAAEAAQP